MRAMKSLCLVVILAAFSSVAPAAPAKNNHFELTAVMPKPEVKADVGKTAATRVEGVVRKALTTNPQLVADLDGAPDPRTAAEAYRKFLTKKGISGAYLVTVEISEASEEVVPMDGKPNSQRLVVHLAIHMLGETIPGRTMGFTGDGQATVKQEIGMKLRDNDRNYAWDGAAETAVNDALKTCFAKLAQPQKK